MNIFFRTTIISVLIIFGFVLSAGTGFAQTNVTLYSVFPTSAPVGGAIVITGTNLLQCAPTFITGPNGCNVQFHDINLRRSTVSGNENSNTQVSAVVAPGLCPGTTTIKVGEVSNFSNAIPFTILDQGNVPTGCRVITSIAPTSGSVNTSVTINGRNLDPNVQLYDSGYGKTDATGTINTGRTQVVFSIPSTLTPGTYSVRVGPTVSDVSNGLPFNYVGDTTAPYISNIRINNITTSGASILWDSSEPADGQVEFCLTNARCTTNSPLISGLTTSHVVNLTGLTANTRYYLWVKSRDAGGNLATGGPLSLRTLSVTTPTPTPPPAVGTVVVSNIQVTNVTRSTATVTWTTDKPSDSYVLSCMFRIFCFNPLGNSPTLTTTHSVNVSGLRANTNYYIQARSTADNGDQGFSDIINFRTQPNLAISNIQVTNITGSSATITWDTNYVSDSGVTTCTFIYYCYVRTPNVSDPSLTLSHTMNVTGLLPSRRYYFQTVSSDSETTAYGSVLSFTTSN